MHFGEGESELFVSGKSSVKVQPEVFDIFLGELHIVDMDRWAGRTSGSEGDMGRLGFIGFHSLFLSHF
jgi:hypothetical protein